MSGGDNIGGYQGRVCGRDEVGTKRGSEGGTERSEGDKSGGYHERV